jgi:hypothetical protein
MYPAKVLGNLYLDFVESSRQIKVDALIRYIDDIVLYCSSKAETESAFTELQYVLSKRHLSLNESKTVFGDATLQFSERKLDAIRRSLVRKRELAKSSYDSSDDSIRVGLTRREREYLSALIVRQNVAQEDIELALTFMRSEPNALQLIWPAVIGNARHLLRGLHRFVRDEVDYDFLWEALKDEVLSGRELAEHDLFWIARLLIDNFEIDQEVVDLLLKIYSVGSATGVVRCAILEIEDNDHGLADLKEQVLRDSGNLGVSACAMVGLASQEKAKRNHALKYAGAHSASAACLAKIASTF